MMATDHLPDESQASVALIGFTWGSVECTHQIKILQFLCAKLVNALACSQLRSLFPSCHSFSSASKAAIAWYHIACSS